MKDKGITPIRFEIYMHYNPIDEIF